MLTKFVILLSFSAVVLAKSNCKVNKSLRAEIQSYKDVVQKIKRAVVDEDGQFRNFTWNSLATFVDKFGSRLAGTQNLEDSIDFLLNHFKNTYELENVHGEDALVPHWIR